MLKAVLKWPSLLVEACRIRQLSEDFQSEGGIRLLPMQYYITIKYTIIYFCILAK